MDMFGKKVSIQLPKVIYKEIKKSSILSFFWDENGDTIIVYKKKSSNASSSSSSSSSSSNTNKVSSISIGIYVRTNERSIYLEYPYELFLQPAFFLYIENEFFERFPPIHEKLIYVLCSFCENESLSENTDQTLASIISTVVSMKKDNKEIKEQIYDSFYKDFVRVKINPYDIGLLSRYPLKDKKMRFSNFSTYCYSSSNGYVILTSTKNTFQMVLNDTIDAYSLNYHRITWHLMSEILISNDTILSRFLLPNKFCSLNVNFVVYNTCKYYDSKPSLIFNTIKSKKSLSSPIFPEVCLTTSMLSKSLLELTSINYTPYDFSQLIKHILFHQQKMNFQNILLNLLTNAFMSLDYDFELLFSLTDNLELSKGKIEQSFFNFFIDSMDFMHSDLIFLFFSVYSKVRMKDLQKMKKDVKKLVDEGYHKTEDEVIQPLMKKIIDPANYFLSFLFWLDKNAHLDFPRREELEEENLPSFYSKIQSNIQNVHASYENYKKITKDHLTSLRSLKKFYFTKSSHRKKLDLIIRRLIFEKTIEGLSTSFSQEKDKSAPVMLSSVSTLKFTNRLKSIPDKIHEELLKSVPSLKEKNLEKLIEINYNIVFRLQPSIWSQDVEVFKKSLLNKELSPNKVFRLTPYIQELSDAFLTERLHDLLLD